MPLASGTVHRYVTGERHLWLAIPDMTADYPLKGYAAKYTKANGEKVTYNHISRRFMPRLTNKWYFHRMPDKIYECKEYPTCHCGRRYVPVDNHKECYFCVFSNK